MFAFGGGWGVLNPSIAAPSKVSSKLQSINHFVVIYLENHSFDNLFGSWTGVNGLSNADPAHTLQVNQTGSVYTCLLQNDVNLTSPPLNGSCLDKTLAQIEKTAFTNRPFLIDTFITAASTTCPAPGVNEANGIVKGNGLPGGCTRDLVHRFYQEQYQIDGGKMDRYVTGSDAIGLSMGVYETKKLPLYNYLHQPHHPRYAILDHFFQAAFGGSFLNHQWLIAAATPVFTNAVNDESPNDLHSIVDANGMPNRYMLYTPTGKVKDSSLTSKCPTPFRGLACGDYAINTIQPFYQPYVPGTSQAKQLPPLKNPTIGDRLSQAGIDWAWYSGGWSNANGDVGKLGWTNGNGPNCGDPNTLKSASYPNCPDKLFQFHHQPFNYYATYAPGTKARSQHLRDEQEFIKIIQSSTKSCLLKAVNFIKPIGEENQHPGYASLNVGNIHTVELLRRVENSTCAKDTMIILTYDEFGGQWDHIPPPGQGNSPGPHDQWGPGTRVPTLVISPLLDNLYKVDQESHDTTSILATIEHRFGLKPLSDRDAQVKDLSTVFMTKPQKQ